MLAAERISLNWNCKVGEECDSQFASKTKEKRRRGGESEIAEHRSFRMMPDSTLFIDEGDPPRLT